MRTVRRLWSVAISFGIVLAAAFPSALAVDTGGWYASLSLPDFALADKWQTPVWAAVYAADVAALSSLFYRGEKGLALILPISGGALNAFWCYVFFRLNSLPASIIVLSIILVGSAVGSFLNFRKNNFAAAIFLLKTVWFSYLLAVSASICAP